MTKQKCFDYVFNLLRQSTYHELSKLPLRINRVKKNLCSKNMFKNIKSSLQDQLVYEQTKRCLRIQLKKIEQKKIILI